MQNESRQVEAEHLVWSVRMGGVAMGIAEFEASPGDTTVLHSRFRTTGFADKLHRVRYQHKSVLGPKSGAKSIESALSRIRSWARPGAAPAQLTVLHDGRPYLVRLASPMPSKVGTRETLRVEGVADSGTRHINLAFEFEAAPSRRPIEIRIDWRGNKVLARLKLEEGGTKRHE